MVGSTLGPYRLLAEIGSGGMGTVYRGEALPGAPVPAGTPVAVKVIHPHLTRDATFVRRFRREAEIGLRIQHRNVVRTLDVGSAVRDGVPVHWIAMEHVEGQTLRALVSETRTAPEALVRHVGLEIARALEAIHAAGVVHRDLKPENVLLAWQQTVKVTDLGVARPMEDATRLSQTGAFVGSLQYAAPEQLASGTAAPTLDGRTDLHALGVILYELAAGAHPYAEADVSAALDRLRRGSHRRLGTANPQVSAFLDELIETLLATDPRDRFPTAAAVVQALEGGEASAWWTERTRTRPAPATPRIAVDRTFAFVGHEGELARLEALLAQARAGQGAVVVVEGEPRVGKTRLLDAFFAAVAARGEDVELGYGRFEPGGAATPTSALASALRERLEGGGLQANLRALVPECATLVPRFAALLRGEPPPTGEEPLGRDAVATLFVRVAHALASRRPLVLAVDDLDLAPPEGRALFASLALAVRGHRILLVGTAGPALPEAWIADLERREHVERTALPRLGAKDLLRLLTEALGSVSLAEEVLAPVATATDGHPLFALEIVRDLEQRGLLRRDRGAVATPTSALRQLRVPPTVLELVRARVAALEAEDRDLLDAAACAGPEFDPILLAEALGTPRLPLLRRLARIEREHGLVRSVGTAYAFDPPQVRDAIHEAMPELLRRESHAALAEALERGSPQRPLAGEPAVQACDHFLRAARPERALPHLQPALTHLAAREQHERGTDLARRALDAPGMLVGPRRLDVLMRLAARLERLGRPAEEGEILEEARALAQREGEAGREARVLGMLGRRAARAGQRAEGERLLRDALTRAIAGGDHLQEMWALANLSVLALSSMRFDEAREIQLRRLEVARASGDTREEAGALGALGLVAVESGRYGEAQDLLRRQLTIAERTGDRLSTCTALGNLAVVAAALGLHGDAKLYNERELEIARSIGYRQGECTATGNLAGALLDLGAVGEALERMDHYLVLCRETGDRQGEAIAHVNLGPMRAVVAEFDTGRAHLEDALALSRESGLLRVEGYGLHGMGEVADFEGRAEEAERWWREALALRRRTGYHRGVADTLAMLGSRLVLGGRADEGRPLLEEAAEGAKALGLPSAAAMARVHLALLPGADPRAGLEAYRELADRLGFLARLELTHRLGGLAIPEAPAMREESRRMLADVLASVPEERREPMGTRVTLFRAILAR